jgi:hypothetical protein
VFSQKEIFKPRPKIKVVGGCFWAHMYAYNVFFEKIWFTHERLEKKIKVHFFN